MAARRRSYTDWMHQIDSAALEALVARVVDELPAEFRERLDNLAFVVEDEPSVEDRRRLGDQAGMLLGLYRGVPLTARHGNYGMAPPDKIVLFQRSLELLARDEQHFVRLVRHTVHHEIAHYFGISDERLRELGAY